MKLLQLLLLLPLVSLPATVCAADPGQSCFSFTSSASSWIGQGQSISATNTTGFDFTAEQNSYDGVSLTISSLDHYWTLDFAAPDSVPLGVGFYFGAQLYPFQPPGTAGLSFAGDGRVNTSLIGYFQVLALDYGPGNSILRFDADFLQYDDGIAHQWNQGFIRFVAVPEPSFLALIATGLLALCFRRRRATAVQDAGARRGAPLRQDTLCGDVWFSHSRKTPPTRS